MKIFYSIFLSIIFAANLFSQIISNPERITDIESMLQQQQQMLGQRSEIVFGFLHQDLTENEMQAMKFLYAYMPLSDLADYDNAFFLRNVQLTIRALHEIPWVRTVPEDEFLHFVLPVRVNNENLDTFRIACYDELRNRVKGLSMYDAALEVNHWCHEKVTYKASDERTSSPLQTMKYSFGRCGEESVFTVAALRTVGIPARQVYTPRWAHSDDNHAWVEVWIDGKWFFMGACEPDPELNMGWFAFPASRTMLVHTRAYGRYFGDEEIITEDRRFSELNLIKNYADTKVITVLVVNNENQTLAGADVDFLLYNYAEFYPIASKQTGDDGTTSIRLGMGEIIVWARNGEQYDFKHVTVMNTDTVILQLTEKKPVSEIVQLNFIPPTGRFVEKYSGEKVEQNRLRLMTEDSLRMIYMAGFKNKEESISIAEQLGYDPQMAAVFIASSYGNYIEIIDFLEKVPADLHNQALMLLSVISEKDLRDAKADVLLEHVMETALLESSWLSTDSVFYSNYVLNSRIDNEMMTNWRVFLKREMAFEFHGKEVSPALIEQWVRTNIRIESSANMHSRAPLTPQGVFRLRVADIRSRNIFFVALCRTFGFPARLHPETRIPQYYFANQWNNVWFENEELSVQHGETAVLYFTNPKKSTTDKYFNSFTVARLHQGRYYTLEYPYDQPLIQLEGKPQEVIAGNYLLVTGKRLSDGTVMAQLTFFEAADRSTTYLNVNPREIESNDQNHGKVKFKRIVLQEFGTENQIILKNSIGKQGMLLVFIDPDKEPSKHVMHDLSLVSKDLESIELSIYFVLNPSILSPAFHPNFFHGLPKQSKFVIDENNTLLNVIVKNTNDTELPLVCLVSPKKRIMFLSKGYRIGTGDEILRLLK